MPHQTAEQYEFDIKNRAEFTWSNTWLDLGAEPERKRFLIIGDSVPREYRGSIRKFLPDYSIDYVGSSSIFDDPLLYDVCEMMFKGNLYHWPFVILALGGNHGHYLHTNDNPADKARYEETLEKFLDYLLARFPDIVIINTAPNKLPQNIKKYDEATNREILCRNGIMQNAVTRKKLKAYIDLYEFVWQNNFKFRDKQHFKNKKIQEKIAKFVIGQLVERGLLTATDVLVQPKKSFWRKLFGK